MRSSSENRTPVAATDLTIENALIFDGDAEDLREGSVRVADGVITEIDQRIGKVTEPRNAPGRAALARRTRSG